MLLGRQWQKILQEALFTYDQRRAKFWRPSYESVEIFLQSVQPNRAHWAELLPVPELVQGPCKAEITDLGEQKKMILLTLSHGLTLSALYHLPEKEFCAPFPLVIMQHGIEGSAEMVMGESDTEPPSYHKIGRKLTEQGFCVLAPTAINNFYHRNRINRLALLLGTNIWALEVQMIRTLLDYAIETLPIDRNRIAMWGHSMGGAYTLYTMPLESRIRAGIISAWFNHRLTKMTIEDEHYTCFLNTVEEHAFLPSLLTCYSDADLLHLICPRPLLIQTGATDSISWPPLVEQEFAKARIPYDRLDIGNRIQWDLHQGGHEIDVDRGITFFKQWLA